VGKTVDGKTVVQGIFPTMSSILGLPLDVILEKLKENNMVVDWIEFYESSKKHGWKNKTTFNRISTYVVDVYGPEYRDHIISTLKKHIELNTS
jgi:hypothetical protein